MSYTNEVLEQDAKDRAQRLAAANRAAWEEILNSTDVTEGEAFYRLVLEFCEGEITFDKFALLQATCPAGFDFTNPKWHQGTRENLLKKIKSAIRSQTPLATEDEIRNVVGAMASWDKAKLRAKLRELNFKQEIRTASDAREYLAKYRLLVSQQQYFTKSGQGPFPRLPLHVVPPGFVTAIPLDAKYIHSLDAAGIRKLTQRYSDEQVTKRINDTLDSFRQ